jgi:hypothetical protein
MELVSAGGREEVVVSAGGREEGWGMLRVQRLLVCKFLVPVRMSWPWWVMITPSWWKVAWQPASQSKPMETREWELSSGKRSTLVAVGGSPAMGRWAVWVEVMMLPSGRLTFTGLLVGWMLIRSVLDVVK